MKRITALLEEINAQANQRNVGPSGRPTSLYEAGGTGGQRPPLPAPQDAAVETGQEQTAEERGRRRPVQAPVPSSSLQPSMARRIRSTLRNPVSFRQVVLMREILDPPVSKRPPRNGR